MSINESEQIQRDTMQRISEAAARARRFERLQEARWARISQLPAIRKDGPKYHEPIRARWEEK